MKVKEFIKRDEDIDIFDDYTGELCIAFVGPMALTPAGAEHFAKALELEIDYCGKVHCEDNAEIDAAIHFFHSAAGYCAASDYDRWFEEGAEE